ncbi:MAG: hypothetical protein M8357_07455 [Desulfobulbaceae bacterium]|nr:hypothetical protein [Desulfobulbaceae bacterium]
MTKKRKRGSAARHPSASPRKTSATATDPPTAVVNEMMNLFNAGSGCCGFHPQYTLVFLRRNGTAGVREKMYTLLPGQCGDSRREAMLSRN